MRRHLWLAVYGPVLVMATALIGAVSIGPMSRDVDSISAVEWAERSLWIVAMAFSIGFHWRSCWVLSARAGAYERNRAATAIRWALRVSAVSLAGLVAFVALEDTVQRLLGVWWYRTPEWLSGLLMIVLALFTGSLALLLQHTERRFKQPIAAGTLRAALALGAVASTLATVWNALELHQLRRFSSLNDWKALLTLAVLVSVFATWVLCAIGCAATREQLARTRIV